MKHMELTHIHHHPQKEQRFTQGVSFFSLPNPNGDAPQPPAPVTAPSRRRSAEVRKAEAGGRSDRSRGCGEETRDDPSDDDEELGQHFLGRRVMLVGGAS